MYNTKETNPKESLGIKKWRYFSTIPFTVMAEVGMALVEGARKYGRHNYRVTGVKASVYVDASMGHIAQWYEGEDIDAESSLSHITKAIASLVILRDAMLQDKLIDDRPPKGNLDKVRTEMQAVVEELFDKYPDSVPAFTQEGSEEHLSETEDHHLDSFRYMFHRMNYEGPKPIDLSKPGTPEFKLGIKNILAEVEANKGNSDD